MESIIISTIDTLYFGNFDIERKHNGNETVLCEVRIDYKIWDCKLMSLRRNIDRIKDFKNVLS